MKKNKMYQCEIKIDEYVVHIYFDNKNSALQALNESQLKGRYHLGGVYSADKHRAIDGSQHIHLYKKMNQLCSMNYDGTGHDDSHGFPLPRKTIEPLQKAFPGIQIPPNGVIESIQRDSDKFLDEEIKNRLIKLCKYLNP